MSLFNRIARKTAAVATRYAAIATRYSDSRSAADFLDPDVPISDTINHSNWEKKVVELANKPGLKALEVGSRTVTSSESWARAVLTECEYTGFDYYPGNNVDVVGDAHKLSSYFDKGEQFDVIFSTACFEHFAMPWLVAQEMAKLLKVGGHIIIETHFSYISHERPWHFFQFSDMALRVLFSPAMGFECLEAGMSNPMIGRFSPLADPRLRGMEVGRLYCHSEFLGKKVREVTDFDWSSLDLSEVVGETKYPKPKSS